MFLNSPTLSKAGHLNQQFFVAERNLKVVVGTGSQTFHSVFVCRPEAANQEYGDIARLRIAS